MAGVFVGAFEDFGEESARKIHVISTGDLMGNGKIIFGFPGGRIEGKHNKVFGGDSSTGTLDFFQRAFHNSAHVERDVQKIQGAVFDEMFVFPGDAGIIPGFDIRNGATAGFIDLGVSFLGHFLDVIMEWWTLSRNILRNKNLHRRRH